MLNQTGNNGATLGEQRLAVFQAAADYWEARLISDVPILVSINFDPLSCSSNSATLGSAGARGIFRNFRNAPTLDTWYVGAVADSLSGSDLSPGNPDIGATFNSSIDNNSSCLGSTNWWLGINSPAPSRTISLFDTVLHEIGHGLGVASLVSSNGQLTGGLNDAYSNNLFDETAGRFWRDMTNAERAASAINTGNVTWRGVNADSNSSHVTQGKTNGHLRMFAPNPYRGGSSISHWDTALSPDELMEPSATPTSDDRSTLQLLKDVGWRIVEGSTPPPPPPLPEPGTIGLRAANVSVVENQGPATIQLERTGGTDGAVSVLIRSSGVSANVNSDYIGVNQRISWADGETGIRTVNVTIVDDGIAEPAGETLSLTLSSVIGGAALGRTSTTLTILDPPNSGVIGLTTANVSVVEDQGPASIQLERTGGSDGAVSVLIRSSGISANVNTDYTGVNQRISWADGETGVQTVNVTIVDDGIAEPAGETLSLILSSVIGGAALGRTVTTLTINDPPTTPNPGFIGFASAGLNVNEDVGIATITLRRTGGSTGAVSVVVNSADISATEGLDYLGISNRVISWSNGQTGNRSFDLTILNDSIREPNNEQVLLTLSNASNGATIDRASTIVTILDVTTISPPEPQAPEPQPSDDEDDFLLEIIPAIISSSKLKRLKNARAAED